MRTSFLVATLAVAFVFPLHAGAQSTAAVVGSGPGVAGAAQTVAVTAQITAIDAASRAVTLKGPRGNEIVVTAGPQVQNFANMKVGDRVNVEYVEALTLELKKGGGKAVARTDQIGAKGAKPGDKPAGLAGRQTTIVADVIDVNAQTQTLTLRGPQRTVELKVADPRQFALVAKGDQVEATYTEALAIAVTPAAAK